MVNSCKWLGHAACQITTGKGKIILIDPWITNNPSCPIRKEELTKADLILVTHEHSDHLGTDVPYLVKTTSATVIVQPELAGRLQADGVSAARIIDMNIGGTVEVAGIKVTMTQAFHSGNPVGFIIRLENGQTIYHAGDTGIFESMRLLGEIYKLDLALLPIGSHYVMDPLQTAVSLTLLKPKKVVPIHYRSFPVLVQDAGEFVKLAKEKAPEVEVIVIEPGQEIQI